MSSVETSTGTTSKTPGTVDLKLEVAVIPVSDVERAKGFYSGLGWRLDADFTNGDAFRVVQFTPPGSPASIHFGRGVTPAVPGSALLSLVVTDIVAAQAALAALGVDVSEVSHRTAVGGPALSGPHPERASYSSFAILKDPDGNSFLLQEITSRLPGRVEAKETAFASPAELAAALRRAEAAHGEHEKRMGGQRDENWPDWYAEYMARERAGEKLPK